MDYHIQNVQTGETVKVDPGGTLIGSAEHATLRTAEGGPYLAAFIVRYLSDWALFGLSNNPTVTFNRRPLHPGQRVSLSKGALLTVGEERFTFLCPPSAKETTPLEDEPGSRPVCFVFVTYPDGKEECRA